MKRKGSLALPSCLRPTILLHSPMKRQPPVTSEAHERDYERLLGDSMELHATFNGLGQSVAQLYETGDTDAAERQSRERHALEGELNQRMQERVALLRETERMTVLEDVVPQIRSAPKTARDAAAISRGLAPRSTRAAARRALQVDEPLTGLNDADRAAYVAARAGLARQHGFEPTGVDPDWFTLRKDGLEFEMVHLPFPNTGILGTSRIAKLSVRRFKGGSKLLLQFDGGWDTACVDPVAQEEIDRLVALFA